MPIEKSAGAVIFRKKKGEIKYLLLHYKPDDRRKNLYWAFSKGRIEKGEVEKVTAKREIKEETGLGDLVFQKGFKEKSEYQFKLKGKIIFKTVVFFLAEVKTEKIIISFEHIGFKWSSFKVALKILRFENDKNILKKANKFLEK